MPWSSAQRYRNRGTTTQRGLGAPHQSHKRYLLTTLVDGSPCRRCGLPRYHPKRCPHPPDGRPDGRCFYCRLERGHGVARVLGGHGQDAELEHAHCNRSAGARLGNHMRAKPRRHSRAW